MPTNDTSINDNEYRSPSNYISGSFSGKTILIQPVLSYAVFSMTNSSRDHIGKAIEGQFDIHQVVEAKEALFL